MKTEVYATANDGTRYRIRFDEWIEHGVLHVYVYVKRRRFPGFRHVENWSFAHGFGVYNSGRPDFVKIAHDCVVIAHSRTVDRRPGAEALRKWGGRVDV